MEKYNFEKVSFRHIAINNNEAWFCNIYYNALFKMDLLTGKINLEQLLSNGKSGFKQYGAIAYWEGLLVIAPLNARNVLIYDICEKSIVEIPLNIKIDSENNFNRFFDIVVYKGNAFLFPGKFHAIVKINLVSREVEYYTDWYNEIKTYIKDEKKIIFSICNEQVGEKFFLPFWQGNMVMCFDMERKKHEILSFKDINESFSGIKIDEKNFWISLKDTDTILKCDRETRQIVKFENIFGDSEKRMGILSIIPCNNKFFVIPIMGEALMEFHKIDGNIVLHKKLISEPVESMKKYIFERTNFLCVEKEREFLILYSNFEGKIYVVDLKHSIWNSFYAQVFEKEEVEKIEKKLFFTKRWKGEIIVNESRDMGLGRYMQCIINRQIDKQDCMDIQNKIWISL